MKGDALHILILLVDLYSVTVASPGGQYTLATTMLLAFLALDVVYVGVVVNYTTQCNLLIFLLRGISERVREKTLTLQHAIKVQIQNS